MMGYTMEEAELCFPQLFNSSCRKPIPPPSQTVLFYILICCVSLLTGALNLLVIISISHFRQLHTPTNFFLLSLAVSDVLVSLLVMPIEIVLTETCWYLGDLMCSLNYLLPVVTIASSVGNMVLISIDRYMAICDPLHYSTKMTQEVAIRCILICWFCSVFYGSFLLYDNLKQPGMYNSCYGECFIEIIGTVDLAFGILIPIPIIIILYTRVCIVAVSQARAMRTQIVSVSLKNRSKNSVKFKKSEMKAARTLGILVVVFLMCYTPYYCVTTIGHNILIGSSIEVYMIFLMYFNSCLNPVIYALFYPWFRKSIRLVVSCKILQPGSRGANML